MKTLTLQAYLPQLNQSEHDETLAWQDIATLEFDDDKRLLALSYFGDYSHRHFLADNAFAVSMRLPVELFPSYNR